MNRNRRRERTIERAAHPEMYKAKIRKRRTPKVACLTYNTRKRIGT
jgi:hypothetical protein